MSFVNQFGKLFNRKTAEQGAETGAADGLNAPSTAGSSLDGAALRDSYQADAMSSVQGDPGISQYVEVGTADEDQVTLPLLGRAAVAVHQRRLLALLAVGVVVLALIAGWVLRQADRSAQQLAATGQALMQSQRLAKSVSQALVGSPQAFPLRAV